jgi:hypothetical protein
MYVGEGADALVHPGECDSDMDEDGPVERRAKSLGLTKEAAMEALREAQGSIWDASVNIWAASFLSTFRKLGIGGAGDEPSLRPFVRRRTLQGDQV